MFDWIVAFVGGVLGIPVTGAFVRDLVTRVINTFLALFNGWIGWIGWFAARYLAVLGRSWELLSTLADWAEYVIDVALPRAIARAYSAATAWAAGELATLRRTISGLVASLTQWAVGEFASLRNTVIGWVNNVVGNVRALAGRIGAVEQRVFGLLTDPNALADWVAGSIVSAVWRWMYGRRDHIARMLLSGAVSGTEWVANLIEQLIVDLFL